MSAPFKCLFISSFLRGWEILMQSWCNRCENWRGNQFSKLENFKVGHFPKLNFFRVEYFQSWIFLKVGYFSKLDILKVGYFYCFFTNVATLPRCIVHWLNLYEPDGKWAWGDAKLSPAKPYSRLSLRFQFNFLRPKARPSSSPDFSSGLNLGEVGPLLGVWQVMFKPHSQYLSDHACNCS